MGEGAHSLVRDKKVSGRSVAFQGKEERRQSICQVRGWSLGSLAFQGLQYEWSQGAGLRGGWEVKQDKFGGKSYMHAEISYLTPTLSHLFLLVKLTREPQQSNNSLLKFPAHADYYQLISTWWSLFCWCWGCLWLCYTLSPCVFMKVHVNLPQMQPTPRACDL